MVRGASVRDRGYLQDLCRELPGSGSSAPHSGGSANNRQRCYCAGGSVHNRAQEEMMKGVDFMKSNCTPWVRAIAAVVLGFCLASCAQQFTTCPGGGLFDENRRALARHGWRFERDHVTQWRWHFRLPTASDGVHCQYSFSRCGRYDSRNVENHRRNYHSENHWCGKRVFGEQNFFQHDRGVQGRRTVLKSDRGETSSFRRVRAL